VRRSAVLAALLGAVALVLRRQARAGQTDRDVWTAATTPPDLR
jgi:hypothetical protein